MFTDPLEELCLTQCFRLREAIKESLLLFQDFEQLTEVNLIHYRLHGYRGLQQEVRNWVEHKLKS